MKLAIEETDRRRTKQREYNEYNNIDPKTIIREIGEELLNLDYGIPDISIENKKGKSFQSKKEIEKEVAKLKKEIEKLAKELDFEEAIKRRDEMNKLKLLLLDF